MAIQPDVTEAAAERVARAQNDYQRARVAFDEANAEVRRLEKRTADLEAERQRITRERDPENALPDDAQGSRLALIAADIESIKPLLAEAKKKAQDASTAQPAEALQLAQNNFEQAQAEMDIEALREKEREAEAVFCDLVSEMYKLGRKLGRTHLSMTWQPSSDLNRLVIHGALPDRSNLGA